MRQGLGSVHATTSGLLQLIKLELSERPPRREAAPGEPPHAKRSDPHVTAQTAGATAFAGIRAVLPDGATGYAGDARAAVFGEPTRVSWENGTFAVGGEIDATDLDGRDLYLVPGLVDAHAHVAWHAFNESDREQATPEQQNRATHEVLTRMLHTGFTSVRDAGGFDPALLRDTHTHTPRAPRVQSSVALIDRAKADHAGGVVAAAEAALERGARWVKLVGTASVASPPGSGLEAVFTRAEQRAVVSRAAEVGAGVMLHAWGGPAIDDAIEAGVMSIEHGIFLTTEQAARAAERRMTLVPTLKIYRLVLDMIRKGQLPAAFEPRVREAVAAHPGSVRLARDAGLAIALGSDFSTPEQHGTNRTEFDDLLHAGLTPGEALTAATRSGAELLARVAHDPHRAPHGQSAAPSGLIADGEIADAVVFNRNPLEPGAFSAQESVIAVIIGGELIDVSGTNTAGIEPMRPEPTRPDSRET